MKGQFYDVLHLFSLTGEPSENHYLLMNGDLVDRGSWLIEVILTAFALKCRALVISNLHSNTRYRAVSEIYVCQSWQSRGEGDE